MKGVNDEISSRCKSGDRRNVEEGRRKTLVTNISDSRHTCKQKD